MPGAAGAKYKLGIRNVCLFPKSSSMDHFRVPFAVIIGGPPIPFTLDLIGVGAPTKSEVLLVMQALQQLSMSGE